MGKILRKCRCYMPHFLLKDDCGEKSPAEDGDYKHDQGSHWKKQASL